MPPSSLPLLNHDVRAVPPPFSSAGANSTLTICCFYSAPAPQPLATSAPSYLAGADCTYTIEAMMGDRKALQAGTSHNLGTNFAKVWTLGTAGVVWGGIPAFFRTQHGAWGLM